MFVCLLPVALALVAPPGCFPAEPPSMIARFIGTASNSATLAPPVTVEAGMRSGPWPSQSMIPAVPRTGEGPLARGGGFVGEGLRSLSTATNPAFPDRVGEGSASAEADPPPTEGSEAPVPPASLKVRTGGGTAKESGPSATAGDDLVEVVVTGLGRDEEHARKTAFRSAIEQVVGSLVLAKDVVENDELIRSKVISVANGFVKRYEPIGKPSVEDGLVEVRLKVWVQVSEVAGTLSENAIAVRKVDGRSRSAEVATKKMREEDAIEALRELFADWPNCVLDVGIVYPDGKAMKIVSTADDQAVVLELWVQAVVNRDKWRAWAELASEVFRACATEDVAGWWGFHEGFERLSTALSFPMAVRPEDRPKFGLKDVAVARPRVSRTIPLERWTDTFVPSKAMRERLYDLRPNSPPRDQRGGVMLFEIWSSRARWFKFEDPVIQEVRRLSARAPVVEVFLLDAKGEPMGLQLRDWGDVDERNVEVWDGDPNSVVGGDQLLVKSLPQYWFSAIPRREFGSTVALHPLFYANLGRDWIRSKDPRGGFAEVVFTDLFTPCLNFPFRFTLTKSEHEALDEVLVKMHPAKPLPDR